MKMKGRQGLGAVLVGMLLAVRALAGCASETADDAPEDEVETTSSELRAIPGVCSSGEIFMGCQRMCERIDFCYCWCPLTGPYY